MVLINSCGPGSCAGKVGAYALQLFQIYQIPPKALSLPLPGDPLPSEGGRKTQVLYFTHAHTHANPPLAHLVQGPAVLHSERNVLHSITMGSQVGSHLNIARKQRRLEHEDDLEQQDSGERDL